MSWRSSVADQSVGDARPGTARGEDAPPSLRRRSPGRRRLPLCDRAAASLVLVGLESSGKSAVFRGLTGGSIAQEGNFKGATVVCRTSRALRPLHELEIVDTPGIRFEDDSRTTQDALAAMELADVVLLVVRATHATGDLRALMDGLGERLQGRRTAIVFTFRDRAGPDLRPFARALRRTLGVPIVALDARRWRGLGSDTGAEAALVHAVREARELRSTNLNELPALNEPSPTITPLEWRSVGPVIAIPLVLALYGVPVYLAYQVAAALQPGIDARIIEPIKAGVSAALSGGGAGAALLSDALVGSYGVVTLGWYSFLWAFPVVVFLGISVALADESGVKDRVAAALDPWLRRIGLDGRDLTPVLTGYGCNVVAVVQTRTCSTCTRQSCVTLIAFGSACSYQIGASLSLFAVAGKSWLFAPYLALLFVVGALHTRLWGGGAERRRAPLAFGEHTLLQVPRWGAVAWKVKAVAWQFLFSAMPIFITVCVVAAALSHFGFMTAMAALVAPALALFRLPPDVAPGLLFSILRKDGLLVLNQDGGAVISALTPLALLVLVYLASTLTACLVTLWTLRRELGLRSAVTVAARQAATSVLSTAVMAWAPFAWT